MGRALFFTFVNGESMVGFWVRHGATLFVGTTIGITCSTYDIFTWFCLFRWLRAIYPAVQPVYERIYGEEMIIRNATTPWLAKAHRIGERIYYFLVPQPDRVYLRDSGVRTYHHYLLLLYFGVSPGGMWTGVCYVLAFRLNSLLAFLILASANACKISLFGYLAIITSPSIVVVLVFSTPFVIRWMENYLREKTPAGLPEEKE
jgi:hypothetical protein